MKCYSLVDVRDIRHYSRGIYTSLENLYVALEDCVRWSLNHEYSEKEIMESYEIRQVILDCEPTRYHEFSTYGKKIEIDWNKFFKKKD